MSTVFIITSIFVFLHVYQFIFMQYQETAIEGVWICTPKIFEDHRGYFMETWRENDFNNGIGQDIHFVQDNESHSHRGVLRGLHYQSGEDSQAKLVRVISGEVLDVAVDLRKSSPTFGKYVAVRLDAAKKQQLFIPRGMAHGFQVLSEEATFAYKVDNHYAPKSERCIRYNDPDIAIQWQIEGEEVCLSEKDLNHSVSFVEADYFE